MTSFGLRRRHWEIISLAASFPPTIAVTAALMAVSVGGSQALFHASVFTALFAVLPALVTLYLLWQGKISDIEVREREERHPLFLTGLASSLLGLAALEYLNAPGLLLKLGIVQTVLVLIVAFINRSWKISVHTTTWGACLTALYFTYGNVALLATPLAVPVAVSRLALDCHTRKQVVAGFVVGTVLTALIMLR
ncbi:MAG: hypothetical protein SV186_02540 [Candidatus Nanohaloarchaea archaeon]|nr:hypothetical protein [Candidatus Nanohaloarchaea archaeon]